MRARSGRLSRQRKYNGMNAKPVTAWPDGKQRPGPPSPGPGSQCGTYGKPPPNIARSYGQLVPL